MKKFDTTIDKWEREFDKKFYWHTCGIEDIKDFIRHSLQQAREEMIDDVMRVVDRHVAWKPTCGYDSEEELGYQKGLIAEAKLMKKDLSDLLTKEEKRFTEDQIREAIERLNPELLDDDLPDAYEDPYKRQEAIDYLTTT